ncbi:adenylyl cyclase [Actinotalea sp. M2MS4P-6]|uniref:glycosyl hydrolase family 28-related protein n=1 Tax=Actinotalea sp. M2MS4P-6 TaxID=2983762 RepID=UPI0021E47CD3|nr:glycosyl hydrolase family 28-related protein [Actinotalea sp. M2MS4P-6]MCV2393158.1 adenylyl cyclase [Actinotalea sp. M2MS4P-6]
MILDGEGQTMAGLGSTRSGRVVVAAVTAAGLMVTGATAASAHRAHGAVDLGSNVVLIDPSMPVAEIQAKVNAIADAQVDDEMGTNRWSVLFTPGTYGSVDEPLQIRVGYYTEIAGLGASPSDVVVHGKIETYNRCLGDDANPNCIALNNFWRTLSNLTLEIDGTGQDGCRASANFWAVSQAVSVRRLDVRGETNFSLMDYCTAGPQYASGGFIADSRFGTVLNGSQQQWLTRNSVVGTWTNGVWNQVFSGVEGAPDETAFPDPPYTTLDQTPVSREKPYLYLDAKGRYQVRVPKAVTDSRGISWADGMTPGRSISLDDFYVAHPGDSVATINAQLARGKNLLLTPGIYDVDRSIRVNRADTVVLGLGHATLTAVDGATPLVVRDVPGVIVAGVTIDAGTEESPVLLQVGSTHGHGRALGHHKSSALDPITLSDVYFRVGGPHIGKADTAMRIDADDVLIDHTWVWRADHGVEGFTAGVNGDTDRWNTNTGRTGVVVTGDDVTATGLFVEHFQQRNLVWEGDGGTVVLFQNELPYDPPTQADWTQPDGTLGYPGYTVADSVTTHELYGAGVYVFNQNNPDIVTASGFVVPETPGVRLHHVMTVNLSAGTIQHVVNDLGTQADNTNTGTPQFIVDVP